MMRLTFSLLAHLMVTMATLLGPGGVKAVVAVPSKYSRHSKLLRFVLMKNLSCLCWPGGKNKG